MDIKNQIDKTDIIKHLEFLQDIIKRMANNSFKIKGWTITLVTAILGLLATKNLLTLKYISILIIPILGFAMLDAYYLRLERIFRKKYNEFVKAYNNKEYDKLNIFELSTEKPENIKISYFNNFFSTSIIGTYAILGALIIVMLIIVA
ncbi:hypothetical protein [Clostridium novyi]|uniref:hypothetical protein n=1 Tax=Clostridium novyi TaxID=1542 RepID=UPI0004D87FFF|nr:hypothetical protein [Clostridium novyi]KEH84728.1 hypothetical protein Z965_p0032 [Clostridium novyi A str. BKT29909]KEI08149.1 hypothetical protein Z958_p0029 [Clostridium novyi B str. NCTC 9691]